MQISGLFRDIEDVRPLTRKFSPIFSVTELLELGVKKSLDVIFSMALIPVN